jgi:hypothetical protein
MSHKHKLNLSYRFHRVQYLSTSAFAVNDLRAAGIRCELRLGSAFKLRRACGPEYIYLFLPLYKEKDASSHLILKRIENNSIYYIHFIWLYSKISILYIIF